MYKLNKTSFNTTTFGAFLLTSSFILKTTLSQMKIENPMINMACLLTFGLGWIITAYALSMDEKGNMNLADSSTLLIIVLSALIATSGMALQKYIKLPIEGDIDVYIKGVFIISFLLLGYISGIEKNAKNLTMNILGIISILVGILVAMPWQQKNNIVNGPSMVLIVLGWFSIIFGNSLESSKFNNSMKIMNK